MEIIYNSKQFVKVQYVMRSSKPSMQLIGQTHMEKQKAWE